MKLFKNEKPLCEAKAVVFKALAHPTRLWITEQLAHGEQCVCEFTTRIDADFSTVSKHLAILKQAGIIEDRKQGKKVFYRLKMPCVLGFMTCIETALLTHHNTQTALLA